MNFLGKEGERLSNYGGIKPLDFIAANAKNWPFETQVITDRNQPEALSFMCERDMLAVMPSLIENSTMAVYEALVHKIPFIATAVGGTPELVGEDFRQQMPYSTERGRVGGPHTGRAAERALHRHAGVRQRKEPRDVVRLSPFCGGARHAAAGGARRRSAGRNR